MIKNCEWCGKEYETNLYWWRFCCEECYKAYSEKRDSRLIKCEVCGEEFHPYSSRAKYCCDECRKIAHLRKIREWQKTHLEKLNEKQRRWREQHPEQVKKLNHQNYLKHKEKRRELNNERSKQYYYTHKEQAKAYQQAHKEERRLASRRRYWKKKIEACKTEHNNCFSCPTLDGECLFD